MKKRMPAPTNDTVNLFAFGAYLAIEIYRTARGTRTPKETSQKRKK